MSQRRQQQRRRRRRARQQRRKRLIATLGAFIAIIAPIAAIGVNIHANAREHSSRQAKATVADLDDLKGSLEPWINGAKEVFDAADKTFKTTGEWRRGTEFREYRSAYRAGTKVRNLQNGMNDAHLVELLDALRSDIQNVCTSTSFHSANEASKAMLRHWDETDERIKELRDSEMKKLHLLG